MIYLLVLLLAMILAISYILTGKDLFAPSTIMTFAFLFSSISAVYNIERWQFELGNTSVFYITTCLLATVIINAMAHEFYRKKTIKIKQEKITPISDTISYIIVGLVVFICIIVVSSVIRIANTSGSIAAIMLSFRAKNAYSTDLDNQFPAIVKQLLNLTNSLSYIFLFNFLYFGKQLSKKSKILNIIVIGLSIVSGLITGARFSSLCFFIAAFVMYYLIKIRKTPNRKVFKLASILCIIVLAGAVLYGFYAVKELVGRKSDQTAVEYITHYAGGSIPGFDLYLKNPPVPSKIIGKETFYSFIGNLRKLGLADIPYYYIHHEFRTSNGISIGNIYTAFRDYHHDFGVIGMYTLHMVFSFIISFFYEREKKRSGNISMIIFAMMYYCIPMYPISNYFFANIISAGFCIKIMMIVVLYTLLLKKGKIKLK